MSNAPILDLETWDAAKDLISSDDHMSIG